MPVTRKIKNQKASSLSDKLDSNRRRKLLKYLAEEEKISSISAEIFWKIICY